ncbi:unnamed protein product [Sphagnum jensenii]|uniref:Protein kinase domain-containing protein n=1 Tax=Sphagnum jensenii TaxID=128206 RepID=A0ABP1AS43_9BRYO
MDINWVLHCDLKPENLLLGLKFNIKIVYFRSSNIMHNGHFFKNSCGIPNYVALQVISIHIIVLPYFWIQFLMKSLYEKESWQGLGVASVEECFDIVWLYSRLSCG